MTQVNGDLSTDFVLDTSDGPRLRISHDGLTPNRTKITGNEIGSTSWSAKLTLVQYGTYAKKPAVLLRFSFTFDYNAESSTKRITSASIKLSFKETSGPDLSPPSPRNRLNDPKIVLFAPVQICGDVQTVENTRRWHITIPVQLQTFGGLLTASPEYMYSTEAKTIRNHHMWLTGMAQGDDFHWDGDNEMKWTIQENKANETGILRSFPGAVVLTLPENPKLPVKMTATVKPFVAFSFNPERLLQKRDDAVYLDRVTEKGEPVLKGMDFADTKFPWADVLRIPSEYENQLVGSA
ncbi:hypothetical protein MMC25_002771 [Agyrium rufum]|nr:hypothetical protein [Agyrium rufum]